MATKCRAGVAGRSGGHIIPCITRILESIDHTADYTILFFSTATELDRSILGLYPHITYIPIQLESFPGKKITRYPAFCAQFIRAFITSFRTLRKKHVSHLVTTGGYISLPVCAAAWVLRIPFEGYELNVVPGKALRLVAPFATTLAVCFEETMRFFKHYRCTKVNYPLRFSEKDKLSQEEGRKQYNLSPHKKTLLLLGGSQGSQALNELVVTFFKKYPNSADHIQIIHQAGAQNDKALRDFYATQGVTAVVFEYEHRLQYAYAAADYVIARAGAGTLFELAFFAKKSLIIPLELPNDSHQLDNAQAFKALYPALFSTEQQSVLKHSTELFVQYLIKGLELPLLETHLCSSLNSQKELSL